VSEIAGYKFLAVNWFLDDFIIHSVVHSSSYSNPAIRGMNT